MPPTDASTDAGAARAHRRGGRRHPGSELPDDCSPCSATALPGRAVRARTGSGPVDPRVRALRAGRRFRSLGLSTRSRGTSPGRRGPACAGTDLLPRSGSAARRARPVGDDLLDRVGGWGPVSTPRGVFQLVPVRLERDLPLLTRWMNDPAVAAFWELAGPESRDRGPSAPASSTATDAACPVSGVLDGTPMSYWEIYRADLDPLARHYPARPHDTGIHLLIGGVADRGRGARLHPAQSRRRPASLDNRPICARVVAEPDLRNTPSVSAFLSAGFRFSAEVDLPDKRAALMVRDRALRDLL